MVVFIQDWMSLKYVSVKGRDSYISVGWWNEYELKECPIFVVLILYI